MTANHPFVDRTQWEKPVVEYLRRSIPEEEPGVWFHLFSSAFQMGVMALVAFGQAEETRGGAVELAEPAPPDEPPRWDDVCCAVLSLFLQRGEIEYRNLDGTHYEPPARKGQFIVRPLNPPPVLEPNIAAAHVCGPARAAPQARELLGILGLVQNSRWTQEAEFVLWREQPIAWGWTVEEDPRFLEGIDICLASLPQREADEIASLVNVTEAQIANAQVEHRQAIEVSRKRYGPDANIGGTLRDADQTKRSLIFRNSDSLDWIFYRGWRLQDGWLPQSDRSSALGIFHDPLAIQMRRAVVRHLHPSSDMATASSR